MDGLTLNKIAGALLAALLVIFGTRTLVAEVFHSKAPEKPGYEVAALEGGESQGGGAPATEEALAPIGPLLAGADPAAGQAKFKACAACHTTDSGGANKVGPNLWGIVNRTLGSHEGFAYSSAMKDHGGAWDYEALNAFLAAPKKYVPGTKMGYAGLKKEKDRADMIAYLRSLADTPAPLPN